MNESEVKERALAGGVSAGSVPPILMLGDHFGYAGGVAHGATVYFLNVLPALKQAGIDLTVCFLREPHPAADALRKAGIEPIFLSARRANPFVVFRVARLVRQRGCRIIHAAGFKATLIARAVGHMMGVQVIVHLHDMNYPGRTVGLLHRLLAGPEDLGICVSRAAGELAVRGYYLRESRWRVAYNGLKLEDLRNRASSAGRSRRATLEISEQQPVIAMVARMYSIKGHRGLLRIMSRVVTALPQAVLLLVGDGPERPVVERLIRELGLQANVRLLGHHDDAVELMAAADIVVVPSLQEGLSLVAIEALAIGRPVVAYAVGGLPEVITDGVDGRLIAPQDEAAFAGAVVGLLRDPSVMQSYGEQGRAAAGRFSLEHHVEVLMGCYRELAGGGESKHESSEKI